MYYQALGLGLAGAIDLSLWLSVTVGFILFPLRQGTCWLLAALGVPEISTVVSVEHQRMPLISYKIQMLVS